jgi:hypothetical protein
MVINRSCMIGVSVAVTIGSSLVALFAPALGNSAAQPSHAAHTTSQTRGMTVEPSKPACSDHDLSSLVGTVNRLRQIHTDSYETNIPPAAKTLLATLKRQLRDLIGEVLASEGGEPGAQQIEARVIEDLRSFGVAVKEPGCVVVGMDYVDGGYDYGQIHSITVTRPRPCFDLIAVTTTIGVCCGEDTSLYLFKREDPRWNLILADEVNDYEFVSDARGTFEFGVSWSDDSGRFFVVATSVNPWCSSWWQSITYRVLRPGPTPFEPHVLLSRTQTIWLGDEPPYRLDVRDDAFTLSFHDERYLDLLNRGQEVTIDDPKGMRVIKYGVEGESVRRKD